MGQLDGYYFPIGSESDTRDTGVTGFVKGFLPLFFFFYFQHDSTFSPWVITFSTIQHLCSNPNKKNVGDTNQALYNQFAVYLHTAPARSSFT